MPLTFADLSPRELRAVNNFCKKGFVVQMSTLPHVTFMDRDTRQLETHRLDDLLVEYDRDRREEARARKAERRLQKSRSVRTW